MVWFKVFLNKDNWCKIINLLRRFFKIFKRILLIIVCCIKGKLNKFINFEKFIFIN